MKQDRFWKALYILTFSAVLIVTQWGSKFVTTMAENRPIERNIRIIIDPGHGGIDGGATSCTGVLESQYNLEIALSLNDLLQLLGYQTEMIRTTDVSVYTSGETISQQKISDLKERVQRVEKYENSILLSIHQNHYQDSRYKGAQIFYADTKGSRELAGMIQKLFSETINPGNKRRIKKAQGIYLMNHITKPGILIECGFISNREEESRLSDPIYQKKICCVIACGLNIYFSNA